MSKEATTSRPCSAGGGRRRGWLRRAAMTVVALNVGAAASLLSACMGDEAALTAEGLPRYAYRTEAVLAGYRHAAQQPDLLAHLPCYCGCGRLAEFQNLRDCFQDATGQFRSHAANCQTCIDEALDAQRWQREGQDMAAIRQAIDAAYQGRGVPTDTPPVK